MKIEYPIAIDNDYAIWCAFENQYWPALYFIDARGRVRQHQFSEDEYERSEKTIQQLLGEAGVAGIRDGVASVESRGVEAPSPENYVGYDRTANFVSPGKRNVDDTGVTRQLTTISGSDGSATSFKSDLWQGTASMFRWRRRCKKEGEMS